ncbi:MAG: hypothetical protein IPM34_01040 [Saprospiraceae bacterium]|nr:hypothetical protein [Saprospiraceae bacterium]
MSGSKWNQEFLDRMRHTGDPLADCAAKALWENKNSKEIIDELKIISRNHKLELKDFPKEVSDYFGSLNTLKYAMKIRKSLICPQKFSTTMDFVIADSYFSKPCRKGICVRNQDTCWRVRSCL